MGDRNKNEAKWELDYIKCHTKKQLRAYVDKYWNEKDNPYLSQAKKRLSQKESSYSIRNFSGNVFTLSNIKEFFSATGALIIMAGVVVIAIIAISMAKDYLFKSHHYSAERAVNIDIKSPSSDNDEVVTTVYTPEDSHTPENSNSTTSNPVPPVVVTVPYTPAPAPAPPTNDSPPQKYGHQCPLCGGSGRKISESYMGQSGMDTKWCEICRREVTITHNHVWCDQCRGDGWCD